MLRRYTEVEWSELIENLRSFSNGSPPWRIYAPVDDMQRPDDVTYDIADKIWSYFESKGWTILKREPLLAKVVDTGWAQISTADYAPIILIAEQHASCEHVILEELVHYIRRPNRCMRSDWSTDFTPQFTAFVAEQAGCPIPDLSDCDDKRQAQTMLFKRWYARITPAEIRTVDRP